MVIFLICLVLLGCFAVAINLKAVYVHNYWTDDKVLAYVWLFNEPKIKIYGNGYKEKIGKDHHIHLRDINCRVRIGESTVAFISRGKICVLN